MSPDRVLTSTPYPAEPALPQDQGPAGRLPWSASYGAAHLDAQNFDAHHTADHRACDERRCSGDRGLWRGRCRSPETSVAGARRALAPPTPATLTSNPPQESPADQTPYFLSLTFFFTVVFFTPAFWLFFGTNRARTVSFLPCTNRFLTLIFP